MEGRAVEVKEPFIVQAAHLSLAIADVQLALADALPDWLFKWRAVLEGWAVARRMTAYETINEWERFKVQARRADV